VTLKPGTIVVRNIDGTHYHKGQLATVIRKDGDFNFRSDYLVKLSNGEKVYWNERYFDDYEITKSPLYKALQEEE
jgi:hypothetical protein